MNKKLMVTIFTALFLIIPVSVFAYSSNQNAENNNTTRLFTNNGMFDYNDMHDWMNSEYGIDCSNPTAHQQFIEEQTSIIQKQLEEGIITQEEADDYLNDLNQINEWHDTHHTNQMHESHHFNDSNTIQGCH